LNIIDEKKIREQAQQRTFAQTQTQIREACHGIGMFGKLHHVRQLLCNGYHIGGQRTAVPFIHCLRIGQSKGAAGLSA
jgi:hypothetical protein